MYRAFSRSSVNKLTMPCPRLRNLSERKLHLPRGVAAPERLAAVVAYEISIKAIRDGFERSRGSRVSGAVFA
jgi:hypothetical protein